MKSSFLFAVLLFLTHSLLSQENGRRMKSFKVVVFHGENKMHSGMLLSLSDSMLNLLTKANAVNRPASGRVYTSYHFSEIDKVMLKRKGSVGKGALIGALAGASLGVITGYISGDDPPCVQSDQNLWGLGYALCEGFRTTASAKASFGGVAGAFGGAVLGVCIGAIVHKKFIIGRNKARYKNMQRSVLERLYIDL